VVTSIDNGDHPDTTELLLKVLLNTKKNLHKLNMLEADEVIKDVLLR